MDCNGADGMTTESERMFTLTLKIRSGNKLHQRAYDGASLNDSDTDAD